jgi:hypothetical protein
MSSGRGCFQNRTFHIITEHDKNIRCCNESSDYIKKVKFGAVINENCKRVTAATSHLSSDVISRMFGRVYPNYELRNDAFDISCNKIRGLDS